MITRPIVHEAVVKAMWFLTKKLVKLFITSSFLMRRNKRIAKPTECAVVSNAFSRAKNLENTGE